MLPGLDLDLDDGAWAMIGADDDATLGLAGHPQSLMRRLIGAIGVKREEVANWARPRRRLRRARLS